MPPATLADLAKHRADMLEWRNSCHHKAVMRRRELIARLGPGQPVPKVAKRMRCSACGSRDVSTVPSWPSMGVVSRHGRAGDR